VIVLGYHGVAGSEVARPWRAEVLDLTAPSRENLGAMSPLRETSS
jgi:hypothetical protein